MTALMTQFSCNLKTKCKKFVIFLLILPFFELFFNFIEIFIQIRLDADNIVLSNVKTVSHDKSSHNSNVHDKAAHKFYQVCVCENGKLFLAPSHGQCSGDEFTVCR